MNRTLGSFLLVCTYLLSSNYANARTLDKLKRDEISATLIEKKKNRRYYHSVKLENGSNELWSARYTLLVSKNSNCNEVEQYRERLGFTMQPHSRITSGKVEGKAVKILTLHTERGLAKRNVPLPLDDN